MQTEPISTQPTVGHPLFWGWPVFQRFNRLFANNGAHRVVARPAGYAVHMDPGHTVAHVEFLGRIDRRQILTLQRQLENLGDRVAILRLDVSRVSGLDMRRLAMLQMLCSSLERKGATAIVIGVPPELQFVALEARLQDLINFG